MIRKLFDQVARAVTQAPSEAPDPADREHSLRLATAVLMVDVARADHEYDEAEFMALIELIARRFELSPQEANELANEAGEKAEDLVSLHNFTQLLHENLSEDEKAQVVSLLWRVAYADGHLHKYEDSLVLKISDLLYVSRARVMRLKHDAREAATSPDA